MGTIKIATKDGGISIALGKDGRLERATIGGLANVFNVRDSGGDVVRPGAFLESLKKRPTVSILFQHQSSEPIGKSILLRENKDALVFRAAITPTRRGQETVMLSEDGAMTGCSIGYRAVRTGTTMMEGEPTRELLQVDLFEISVCTFPMNEQSRLKSAGFTVGLVKDLLLIAEVEDLQAKGWHVSERKMRECLEAEMRQLERMQHGGKRAREHRYAVCFEIQEEMKKLKALERRAARLGVR